MVNQSENLKVEMTVGRLELLSVDWRVILMVVMRDHLMALM